MTARLGRRRPTALFFSLLLFVGLGIVPTVHAATVVLVRSPQPTADAAEATVRLRGELVSAGFDVRVIDPPLGADTRASLEEAAAGPEVEAVVAILGGGSSDASGNSAELWVIDRVTGKTVVRRVPTPAGSTHGAEVLSIRALELLRASFLEVALSASHAPKVTEQPPAPPPSTEVTRLTNAAIADVVGNRWPSTWALEAGGCVLGSLEGVTPSVMPLVRVQRAIGDQGLARITFAGFGTRPRITNAQGGTGEEAEVVQQFGILEAGYRFRANRVFQPFISAGAGSLHVSAAGYNVSTPIQPRANERWSLLGDVGTGVHLWFHGRFELAMEAHAQFARPYPVIRYLTKDIAVEGRPSLIGSLTLMVWM